MRHIDITNAKMVQLWSGRRLHVEDKDGDRSVVALPKGAMATSFGTLYFGGVLKNTVAIKGPKAQLDKLMNEIVGAERPVEGYVNIK